MLFLIEGLDNNRTYNYLKEVQNQIGFIKEETYEELKHLEEEVVEWIDLEDDDMITVKKISKNLYCIEEIIESEEVEYIEGEPIYTYTYNYYYFNKQVGLVEYNIIKETNNLAVSFLFGKDFYNESGIHWLDKKEKKVAVAS